MASIRLEDLHKTFPNGGVALRGLDLQVEEGELLVLVGPSGCGKSTVLRLVAGLDSPSRGRVLLDGQDITDWTPQKRELAMVFQSYALYPHMTVRENLAFGLRMRGVSRREREQRTNHMAGVLGLEDLLERRPAELSGGQRQRVALGRAIVREPKAFLFDEPLSNLDARLRGDMRAELARLHRRLGATMLYVTHDQEEALTLGDRVAVLREGRVLQLGAPMDVYDQPEDRFVAGFIGSPPMNLLRARPGPERSLELPDLEARLDLGSDTPIPPGTELVLGVRPPDLTRVPESEADLTLPVDVVESLGDSQLIHLRSGADATFLRVLCPADPRVQVGEPFSVRLRRDRLHYFDPTSGRRL